jgi:hypothetical protein
LTPASQAPRAIASLPVKGRTALVAAGCSADSNALCIPAILPLADAWSIVSSSSSLRQQI